jgi:hypothetical protein
MCVVSAESLSVSHAMSMAMSMSKRARAEEIDKQEMRRHMER